MFMIFLTVCGDEDLSNLRSSSKDTSESDDLPISPRVLINKLINVMVGWLGMRSDIREWYFAFFRSLLLCMLDSNPTVSSRIYKEVPLTSTRSGLRESPVIMLGDRNEGRSGYNEHVGNEDKVFAR